MGAAVAGDKDKDKTGYGASFDTLDANRDGRISQAEASADTTIVFTSADANGDGYLDKSRMEESHEGRDQPHAAVALRNPRQIRLCRRATSPLASRRPIRKLRGNNPSEAAASARSARRPTGSRGSLLSSRD